MLTTGLSLLPNFLRKDSFKMLGKLGKLGNYLDNLISVFSPKSGLVRAQYRLALEQTRKYYGAQISKTDKNWTTSNRDADSEILPDLSRLRSRSRDLIRNNPWATSVIDAFVANVVGKGIRVQAQVYNPEKNSQIEDEFNAAFKKIDLQQVSNFYEIQGLAFRQLLECGESFIRIIFERGILKLQMIEPDQIYSMQTTSEFGNEIRAGIEIDKNTGRHIAYYINAHPGQYGTSFIQNEIRILSQDMIHLFLRTRPNQTRGVPILAPVISVLHDLGEYVEAELVSARVAACLSVFIKKSQHGVPTKDEDNKPVDALSPGMIARLRPGEDIAVIEPKRPGDQFGKFTSLLVRAVAAGTGLCYETISKDFSQVNYSSARAALLGERTHYRFFQNFLINHLCEPVADEMMNLKYLRGEGPRRVSVKWLPPGFEWVDPQKEIAAQVDAVENNLQTKASVIAERGGDWKDVFEQRQIEKEMEAEKGIAKNEKKSDTSVSEEEVEDNVNG